MSDLLSYLLSLESPEQVTEAINALSPEKRKELVQTICFQVNGLAKTMVENKEHIWFTGELP